MFSIAKSACLALVVVPDAQAVDIALESIVDEAVSAAIQEAAAVESNDSAYGDVDMMEDSAGYGGMEDEEAETKAECDEACSTEFATHCVQHFCRHGSDDSTARSRCGFMLLKQKGPIVHRGCNGQSKCKHTAEMKVAACANGKDVSLSSTVDVADPGTAATTTFIATTTAAPAPAVAAVKSPPGTATSVEKKKMEGAKKKSVVTANRVEVLKKKTAKLVKQHEMELKKADDLEHQVNAVLKGMPPCAKKEVQVDVRKEDIDKNTAKAKELAQKEALAQAKKEHDKVTDHARKAASNASKALMEEEHKALHGKLMKVVLAIAQAEATKAAPAAAKKEVITYHRQISLQVKKEVAALVLKDATTVARQLAMKEVHNQMDKSTKVKDLVASVAKDAAKFFAHKFSKKECSRLVADEAKRQVGEHVARHADIELGNVEKVAKGKIAAHALAPPTPCAVKSKSSSASKPAKKMKLLMNHSVAKPAVEEPVSGRVRGADVRSSADADAARAAKKDKGSECSASCSDEFINGCMKHYCKKGTTGTVAYSRCKGLLAGGRPPLSKRCAVSNCRDTPAMLALKEKCPE